MKESSMFGLPQGMEIVVLLVVVLLLFGGSRLAGMSKAPAGRSGSSRRRSRATTSRQARLRDHAALRPGDRDPAGGRLPSPEQRAKDV
jgi:Sec-independent protein translocase protein TatA